MRATAALAVGMAITAFSASSPAAATTSAAASPATEAVQACREVDASGTVYQWVVLVRCDDGWYGARRGFVVSGDQVWLVSASGTITGLRTARYDGAPLSTPTVGIHGGPWKACARFSGQTWCTIRD
jgi:hypothetical protein